MLTKSGAAAAGYAEHNPHLPSAGPVIYTLKNPEPAFLEATRQAAERARSLASKKRHRASESQTKGIIDVRITRPLVQQFLGPPNTNSLNPLNELHLQYSSYVKDDVTVQATVTAGYSIQH